VRLEGYGRRAEAVTDEEGYFDFELPIDAALPETTRWEQVTLSTPGREAQQPSDRRAGHGARRATTIGASSPTSTTR
jgi:hypothetical protein